MPVRKVKGGWKYGTKGKAYKSKAKAEREKAEQWELSEHEKEIIKSLSAVKNEVQTMPIIKEYITLNKTGALI